MKKTTIFVLIIFAAMLSMGAQFPRDRQTVSVYQYPDFLTPSPVSLSLTKDSVTAMNVSGKKIRYLEIEVEFPSTRLPNLRLSTGSKHYLAPDVHAEEGANGLRVGASHTFDLQLPRTRLAIIRPVIVLFDNDVGWIVGYPVHRDATNSAHWTVDEDFQSALKIPKPNLFTLADFRRDGPPDSGNCYRFEGSTTVQCGAQGCSANVFTIRRAQDGFKQKQRIFTCSGGVACGTFTGDDTDNGQPCLSPDIE